LAFLDAGLHSTLNQCLVPQRPTMNIRYIFPGAGMETGGAGLCTICPWVLKVKVQHSVGLFIHHGLLSRHQKALLARFRSPHFFDSLEKPDHS
jgi:hypothetical protein